MVLINAIHAFPATHGGRVKNRHWQLVMALPVAPAGARYLQAATAGEQGAALWPQERSTVPHPTHLPAVLSVPYYSSCNKCITAICICNLIISQNYHKRGFLYLKPTAVRMHSRHSAVWRALFIYPDASELCVSSRTDEGRKPNSHVVKGEAREKVSVYCLL